MLRKAGKREAALAASLFLLMTISAISTSAEIKLFTSENSPLPSAGIWSILFDHKDRLWLGTGKGIYVFDRQLNTLKIISSKSTQGKLKKDFVVKIYEDSQRRYWFATRSSFIGGGGVTMFDGKEWLLFTTENTQGSLPSNYVWDIAEDKKGRIWFATDKGVAVYENNQWTHLYNRVNTGLGLPGDSVWDIFIDKQGNLWFATDRGVGWFDGRHWRNVTKHNSPLPSNNVAVVFVDSEGRYWFGLRSGLFKKGGVILYDGRDWIHHTTENGLPHNDINVIYEDKNQTIWIGTRGGVASFKNGKFKKYITKERVWDIAEDKRGNLYFATSRGLAVLSINGEDYLTSWRKKHGAH